MPVTAMPAIDQSAAASWTPQQVDLYADLPYYLAKMQVDRMKHYQIWNKVTDKIRWKPNMGDTMRAVRSNPSPHLRQFAYPRKLDGMPRKDVMNVREVSVDANVYRHRFESPALNFVPSFNDFMDHVDDTAKDIMEKIERFGDIYTRSNIWQMAPFVFICTATGVKLIKTGVPFWTGTGNFTEGADGKTATYLKEILLPQVNGNLTLLACAQAMSIAEVELRLPFWSGSNTTVQNGFLNGKYCFITSNEAYTNFTFDPYLQQNKNCDLNVVSDSFRGELFGRGTTQLEDLPMRCDMDGVFANPELRVEDSSAYDNGETLPNPVYAEIAQSPIEIGFLCGAKGYSTIEVGPPPSQFTGDSAPHNFPAMFWNGEVKATKQRLIKVVDSDDSSVNWEMNTYGEYLWWISQATFGVLPKQRRNIIPILYLRKRPA